MPNRRLDLTESKPAQARHQLAGGRRRVRRVRDGDDAEVRCMNPYGPTCADLRQGDADGMDARQI